MPQTASEVFEQAMDAEYTDGNLPEAITLYQAAEQLYKDEGSPADAEACHHMVEIVMEKLP